MLGSKSVLVLAVFITSASLLFARAGGNVKLANQKDAKKDSVKVTNAKTIIVTGQYSPTTVGNSVQKIRVIDEERLKAQQAQSLRDALLPELTMRVTQDNILGSGLSVQGVGGQNIKILVDGLPVNGRLDGNIDLSQLLLNNAQRVEIVEGPMSTLYGTDALGGLINIITKQTTKTTFTPFVNTYYESTGTYNIDGGVQGSFADVNLQANGGRYVFDGWSENEQQHVRSATWKPREQYFADWKAQSNLGSLSVLYSGRLFHELILNRGEPRAPYYETAFDDTYRTERFINSVNLSYAVASDIHATALLGYSAYKRTKNTYFKNLVTLQSETTTQPGDQDTSRFSTINARGTIASINDTAALNWEGGFDIVLDRTQGVRINNAKQNMNDLAAFGSLRWQPVSEIIVLPSIRYAYNSIYGAPLTPAFNVRYTPLNNTTVRASYARGFRAPSLRELYMLFVDVNHNIQGNTALQAEQSNNIQCAVELLDSDTSITWKYEVSGFYNDISNLITLALVEGQLYSYVNIGRFSTLGATATITCSYPIGYSVVGFSAIGRTSYAETNGFTRDYAFAPEVRFQTILTDPLFDIQWGAFIKYTGALPTALVTENGTVQNGSIQAYTIADVTATYTILKEAGLTFSAGVKNLLNITAINAVNADGGAHSSGTGLQSVAQGRMITASLRWTP